MTEQKPCPECRPALGQVIFGAWQAGGKNWGGSIDDTLALAAMRAALDAGINAIDTAPDYGNGHSERLVAQAVRGRRDKTILLTKIPPNRLHFDAVLQSCEKSLENLQTDWIDAYFIHWPSGSFGMKPVSPGHTMDAINRLKDQGKIRFAGICNAWPETIESYSKHGSMDFCQAPYSLFWPHAKNSGLVEYCHQRKIRFLAYSPLAQGILAGRFGQNCVFEAGDHRSRNRLFLPQTFPAVLEALKKLEIFAKEKNISPAQLALAFVLCSAPGVCAIAGARTPLQAKENALARAVCLEAEEISTLLSIAEPVVETLEDGWLPWNPP
ncbi:MAG: aldo/keto reductase [Desulfatibacillaceae bacterium]|nr:aldo/keto reductase [Desulfatibacillaceae bacterium]